MKLIPTNETRSVFSIGNPFFPWLTRHGFFKKMEDERYLRLLYRGITGRPLHLDPPELYSEKIQWFKLHDKNPIYPVLCDKLAVRNFVRERVGEEYLITLYGDWDVTDQIDLSALPNQFVLKCTHDSGSVIICKDKAAFNFAAAKRALKKRLSKDYSVSGREWPYGAVPRRVIAEAFIGLEDGTRPDDYKFYCIGGRMFWVCICTNRRGKSADYYLCDRAFRPFWTSMERIDRPDEFAPPVPPRFAEMIELSERLAEGFLNVRVDLYNTPDGIRFGEMTLYDQSGFIPEYWEAFDRMLGELVDLTWEPVKSPQQKEEILNELRNAFINSL